MTTQQQSTTTTKMFLVLLSMCASTYGAALLPIPLPCAPCTPIVAPCHCGLDSGEEICSKSNKPCGPLVVRPLDLPRPILPPPPAPPVKSPCSCSAALVRPATVPRPVCRPPPPPCACPQYTGCNTQYAVGNTQYTVGCNQQYAAGNQQLQWVGAVAPQPIVVGQGPRQPLDYVPADPVSLSVAYKRAQEATTHHTEDKLSFGFRVLPREAPPAPLRRKNHIAEEGLYNLNGQIVELKKVASGKTQSLDEEAAEALLELADEAEVQEPETEVKKISLGEIGYGPAKIQGAPFIDVPVANPLEAVVEEIANTKVCNDGFKPGNVVVAQVPKLDSIALPAPLPEPCDSVELPFLPAASSPSLGFPPPLFNPLALVAAAATSAASSSSSNQFHQTHNVVFQKLGCN